MDFKMNSKAVELWILNSVKRLIVIYQMESKSIKVDALQKAKEFLTSLYYILDEDIKRIEKGEPDGETTKT